MVWARLARWRLVRTAAQVLFRKLALRRLARLDHMDMAAHQEATLLYLVRKATDTRFGKEHGFARIRTVGDFQQRVRLRTYEDFWRDYWQATFPDIQGSTWPTQPPYFALSSGTSTGNTKYLPVNGELLASHRSAALCLFGSLWATHPELPLLQGRLFFLGGSTDLASLGAGIRSGDLS
ncbi:hypothetical protein HRbin36_00949 [bacterium HR36]|nr:hypothetical protein HRbin36_00949 [bacterium HR36]